MVNTSIPFRGLITLDIVTYELRTTKVSKQFAIYKIVCNYIYKRMYNCTLF